MIMTASTTALTAASTCTSCYMAVATSPASDLHPSLTGMRNSSFVFTAYSVNSQIEVNGSCTTTQGEPFILPTPYSVVTTADQPNFALLSAAGSSFIDQIGFASCGVGVPAGSLTAENVINASASASFDTALAPSLSLSTAPASFTGADERTRSNGLGKGAKIALGIGIPVFVLLLLFAFLFFWGRLKRAKSLKSQESGSTTESHIGSHPYLQQKAELEDEARRRHELDGEWKRYELDGTGTTKHTQELPGEQFADEMN